MATPSFTISFGSQQIAVSSLNCNSTTYPEYSPLLLPGWTAVACSSNPLLVNSRLTVAKTGEANQTLLITAISPTVPTSQLSLSPTSTITPTVSVVIDATETVAIRKLLEPWLTPGFFNLVMAFMLLCMFWGGFASGSRTAGRGF
jgi:hypothetical protein